jgi:tetratricopeptide (TPR) repeat protein
MRQEEFFVNKLFKAFSSPALSTCLLSLLLSPSAIAESSAYDSLMSEGLSAHAKGHYRDAEKAFISAVNESEKFGPANAKLTTTLNDLALVCQLQAKFAKAETTYQRVLDIYEKNDRNDVYGWGNYSKAEPYYNHALALREKQYGPDDPQVAGTLSDLAALYGAQHRYPEQESICKRAVDIYEKQAKPDRKAYTAALTNLAAVYYRKKDWKSDELVTKTALAINEQVLNQDHPELAALYHNLGTVYTIEENYPEAETNLKHALAIRQKSFGADNPLTLAAIL